MLVVMKSTCDISSVGSSVARSWRIDLLLISVITRMVLEITNTKSMIITKRMRDTKSITDTTSMTNIERMTPQTVCSGIRISAAKKCGRLSSIPG